MRKAIILMAKAFARRRLRRNENTDEWYYFTRLLEFVGANFHFRNRITEGNMPADYK